ncbi:putative secreted protein [Corynebacterium renale]|uniref:Uncharacterized protein n=1 Tax=Corynebacterium renale TaxID=1724 RepID=A0A2A9DM97_9CORY|nr:hypothetical protein ATK06_0547 [Corynebacterium renale]SQI23274.1 putative secreted protein [Corynebacterium renale]
MKNSKFKNRAAVAKGTLATLLGVLFYCFAVAPIFKQGTYSEVATHTFRTVGAGLGLAIVVIGGLWITVLSLKRH